MSGQAPTGITPPNFRTARLVGIFNVLFAAQILICGLCMGGYTLSLPLWSRVFSQAQKQAERQGEAARQAQLDAALEQEKAAKTEAERVEATARRMEVQSRPKATIPGAVDFTKMGFSDPVLITWAWVEVVTGLVLNVALLASGVGLLHWKPWARSLGVWTAALKVVRLVALYSIFIVAVVPPLARQMGAVVSDMMVAQQPGMRMPDGESPGVFFARIYTITYSVYGVGIILFGVLYPALLLWLLTRPGVRSACSGRLKLPKEPNQP